MDLDIISVGCIVREIARPHLHFAVVQISIDRTGHARAELRNKEESRELTVKNLFRQYRIVTA